MRIRKQASKLLGWAVSSTPSSPDFWYSPASQSWPPPPPPSPVKDGVGELQCQLNLSPWDAIGGSHHCMNFQNLTTIAAIGCDFEGKQEQFTGSSPSEIAEAEVEERTAGVKKETKTMKRRETEEVVAAAEGLDNFDGASPIKYCKKTDGKRWRCKRPAQLPHSLCGYHRTQHRSYANQRREEASLCSKKNPANGGSAASDSYYYYSVFGPWWSKRRGSPFEGGVSSESSDQLCVSVAAAESDGDRKKVTGQVGSNGNDKEEKEEVDGGNCCKYMQLTGGRGRAKKTAKKTAKKRGRKRVKARSLKSLF